MLLAEMEMGVPLVRDSSLTTPAQKLFLVLGFKEKQEAEQGEEETPSSQRHRPRKSIKVSRQLRQMAEERQRARQKGGK
jgi:hypothetical protein